MAGSSRPGEDAEELVDVGRLLRGDLEFKRDCREVLRRIAFSAGAPELAQDKSVGLRSLGLAVKDAAARTRGTKANHVQDGSDNLGPRAPKDPKPGPVSAGMLPTPTELTADALSDWITKNPNAKVGGVRILPDLKAIVVYLKGTPPTGLRSLAAAQAIPVTFQASPYSLADLDPIARQVLADHRDVVSSASPSHDYSGVSVTLWSTAPVDSAMTELNAKASVPIIFDKLADPVDLAGNNTDTSTRRAQTCWHRGRVQ